MLIKKRQGLETIIEVDIPPIISSYIAGIVDGEGSIFVRVHNRTRLMLTLAIRMCSREPIELVADTYYLSLYGAWEGWAGRPSFYIEAHGQRAQAMLRNLLPYLRTKRRQAEVALLFPLARSAVAISDDVRERQEVIKYELWRLNHGER